jgi:16S rRNA (uracil1498-N3)-methyltransferase
LLEKTTEIGVAHITPLITKRSEKIFFKKERFEKILVSAMLQSQQTFLPILNEPIYFEEILKSTEPIKLIAHCLENEKKIMRDELKENTSTIILIGPEGDFTPEEINAAMQNNFIPVSLGNKRLRTETAGLYACVVFNSL